MRRSEIRTIPAATKVQIIERSLIIMRIKHSVIEELCN